jgi:hypothetical protein
MKATTITLEKLFIEEQKMYDEYQEAIEKYDMMISEGYFPKELIQNQFELIDIKKYKWLGARELIRNISTTKQFYQAEESALMKKGAGALL